MKGGFRAHFLRERGRERVGEALGWFSNVLIGSGLWCR